MADLGESSCIAEDLENVESAKMETDSNSIEGQSISSSHNINVDRDFTTEIFKIEIGNLPKCYSVCVSNSSNLLANFEFVAFNLRSI